MDIKVLFVNSEGLRQEHSESADSVKFLSFKTANNELTDSKLGRLIDGAEANTEHYHDNFYFRESEHIVTSAGAADAGKPIKLDAGGKLDESLIDVAGLNALLDHGSLLGLGDDDHTIYIKADGTRAFTGAQSMGGFKLTNLANPSAGTDAVNLQTLQAYQQGMKPKEAVKVATTVAGTLATSFAAGQVVDGYTLVAGNRILIKDQAAQEENGIYVVQASGAPVRAVDFDSLTPIDEINGALVGVQSGTANAGKTFVEQSVVSTLGVDSIVFVFFNAADAITASNGLVRVVNDIRIDSSAAGNGLGFSAGVLSVNVDGSSIEINSDTLRVKADGINDTHIDWGTGANQVSAVDVPIADAGAYFATDNVEAALQYLAGQLSEQGVIYTVGAGGVTKGDLVYVSAPDVVSKFSTLSADEYCVGIALNTVSAGGSVKVLANDTVVTGVLSGASAGAKVYWNGSGFVYTPPTGAGGSV
jgi:hypothetical protein